MSHRGARATLLEWLSSLPHPALIVSAAFVFIVLAVIFAFARPSSPALSTLEVWGGAGQSALDPTSYTPSDIPPAATDTPTLGSAVSPIYIQPTRSSEDRAGVRTDTFDVSALIAMLTKPPSMLSASSSTDVPEAYSFIPSGLISTTSLEKKRTASQQALYEYGNDAGGFIQSYEDAHRAVSQTLTDQFQDRYNPQKAQAVKDIGDALISLGKQLEDMTNVPSQARSAHEALAKSYKETGAKFKFLAEAKTDQALLRAVNDYNASVDTFIQRYTALAQLFSISGVTFVSGDSGSVFTFSASGL